MFIFIQEELDVGNWHLVEYFHLMKKATNRVTKIEKKTIT
jgi:hypothetical protein